MKILKLCFDGGEKEITVAVGNQYWKSATLILPKRITVELIIKRRYLNRTKKRKK